MIKILFITFAVYAAPVLLVSLPGPEDNTTLVLNTGLTILWSIGLVDCCNCRDHERRRDVARSNVDNPGECFARIHGEPPEVAIVSHDHTTELVCATQELDLLATSEPLVVDGANVLPLFTERLDHLGVDVLIRQQRKGARVHAGIFTSQTTSFLRDRAAYWMAAPNPSGGT